MVNDGRFDRSFADGGSNGELKDENGNYVKKRRPNDCILRLQYASRNDRRNRVGGIVEAVHEIKYQCHRNQKHNHFKTD